MDTGKTIPKGKGFTTGDFFQGDFGSIIEGLFVTSDGFAIQLYDMDAWFVRRDPNHGDPLLCVALDDKRFPYDKPGSFDYFNMQIKIMSATNVKTVHQAVMGGTHQSE